MAMFLGMSSQVSLPVGINYVGQLESSSNMELDRTQWTVLRDHTNLVVYFNSPANPQFQVRAISHAGI